MSGALVRLGGGHDRKAGLSWDCQPEDVLVASPAGSISISLLTGQLRALKEFQGALLEAATVLTT